MKESYIYILTNKNKTVTYIGVTSKLKERIAQHKNNMGCFFTKKYNVHILVYFEVFTSIKQAIDREKQLKKWNKSWKWELIKKVNSKLLDLYNDL